jgi:SAM-dependent methyltransferase
MDSPSAQRNKEPIWGILESHVLPSLQQVTDNEPMKILEVAAGCGVHTEYFTTLFAEKGIHARYHPTDPDPPSLASLQERVSNIQLPTDGKVFIQTPCSLTLDDNGCMEEETSKLLFQENNIFHLMICINMIHISPWDATKGLIQIASKHLKHGGILYTYGPYKENGTAVESNLNFDASLKSRNPAWGVRNLEDVVALAELNGLRLVQKVPMPANNLSLIFVKESPF